MILRWKEAIHNQAQAGTEGTKKLQVAMTSITATAVSLMPLLSPTFKVSCEFLMSS